MLDAQKVDRYLQDVISRYHHRINLGLTPRDQEYVTRWAHDLDTIRQHILTMTVQDESEHQEDKV